MRSKRGAVEIQFNWLFVLIIGAIILIIFTTIVLKQKSISEKSQSALLLRHIDSTLSGNEAIPGVVTVVPIPEARIEFRCDGYSIGGLFEQVDVMNVFTPSIIQGRELVSMTLDWSVPFRITNVLYLTSPTYRYILVGTNSLSTEMFEMMPNETFIERATTLGNPKYRGENKVRFVFFDGGISDGMLIPDDFISLPDEDVSALKITGDENLGNVEFFVKAGDQFISLETSSYIKLETLLGAIIADSPNIYNCVMENLFSKVKVVGEIYTEKMRRIRSEYQSSGDRCKEFAGTAYNPNALTQISSAQFTKASVAQLLSAEKKLKDQNRRAQRESCATIY